jgi:hypothetical protein
MGSLWWAGDMGTMVLNFISYTSIACLLTCLLTYLLCYSMKQSPS